MQQEERMLKWHNANDIQITQSITDDYISWNTCIIAVRLKMPRNYIIALNIRASLESKDKDCISFYKLLQKLRGKVTQTY
jgi:hypothetical protein